MLYITTRNRHDAQTVHWPLTQNCAADGGAYIPFKFPVYTGEGLSQLKQKTFGEATAEILNAFFATALTGLDLEFMLGRAAMRAVNINRRVVIAETWRNLEDSFRYALKVINGKLTGNDDSEPTNWVNIAVRVAYLFGIYTQMPLAEGEVFDISLSADDLYGPVAACYAKQMGLPIGKILCCCEDNSLVWNLIQNDTVNTAGLTACVNMERLIHYVLGEEEAVRFAQCCADGAAFAVQEEQVPAFREQFFAVVISSSRPETVMHSVFRTSEYIMDPVTAATYGGLQDYRAISGESRTTLLLSEESPVNMAGAVLPALGITGSELRKRIYT